MVSLQGKLTKGQGVKFNKVAMAFPNKQVLVNKEEVNTFPHAQIKEENVKVLDTWEGTCKRYIGILERKQAPRQQHWLSAETWGMMKQKADEEYWWTMEGRTSHGTRRSSDGQGPTQKAGTAAGP